MKIISDSSVIAIAAGFSLFTLWDFYLPSVGIRLFDFAGYFLMSALFLIGAIAQRTIRINITTLLLLVAFSGFVFYLIVLGMVNRSESLKTAIGITMGFSIFLLFYTATISARSLLKILDFILVVHIAALFVQWAYYFLSGQVLNMFWLFDTEPRAMSSIFRPTGLFQEPAAYSATILMLIMLRVHLLRGLFDCLTHVALISIFLTLSVWGWLASTIFVAIAFRWRNMRWRDITLVLIGVVTVLAAGNALDINLDDVQVVSRVMNIGDDSSANVRYGWLKDIPGLLAADISLWFGGGVGQDNYVEFGNSGIGFLLSAGGIVGLLLFAIFICALSRRGTAVRSLTFIFLCMTAAPYWTSCFWWAWIALMIRSYDLRLAPFAGVGYYNRPTV